MKALALRLIHIRNHPDFSMDPDLACTVLAGPNGAGKTNLIEALYFSSIGRSFRGAPPEDLITFGEEEGTILLDFSLRQVRHQIKVRLSRKESPRFFMNDTKIRRKEIMGIFRTVLFTPDEMRLIKGAPQDRRRFLDLEVSQVSPRYYAELLRYNRAVMQRNAALRQAQIRGTRPDIDMWDSQIASGAAYITRKRQESLAGMNAILEETGPALTAGKEHLRIGYRLSGSDGRDASESWYLEKLAALRESDSRLCRTSVGPHRDDLLFEMNGLDMARFASQGQQRTAILAVKLAEMKFIQKETGEYPVLLLDDIGSELDEARRHALFHFLENAQIQTIVSAAEPGDIQGKLISLPEAP